MKTENKTITDRIIDGLRNAATEIEALRVQIALGKAEARDLYEEVKKDFNRKVREARLSVENLKKDDSLRNVVNAFEHIQVQLALGMAETEEVFREQQKKISEAIGRLESDLRNDPQLKEYYNAFKMEVEKFKLKLELLSLHYKLKKIRTEYEFEEKKEEFKLMLEKLRVKLNDKEASLNSKFENFQDEIKEAFHHLKKAFQ